MKAEKESTADEALDESTRCAEILRALGDPHRFNIIRALQNGPLTVSDIATLLEIDLTIASHHLRVLYHADLVETKRDGRFVYYCLNKEVTKGRVSSKLLDFGCCKLELRPH